MLLLPPGAGKGSAVVHVSDRLGFPPDRVLVAVSLFQISLWPFTGSIATNVHFLAMTYGDMISAVTY